MSEILSLIAEIETKMQFIITQKENCERKIAALESENSQINYYKAIAEIGSGIKPVTVGSRGNTGNGGYSVLGKTYKTLDAAEKALAKYLDGLNLSEKQIVAIYEKLGM